MNETEKMNIALNDIHDLAVEAISLLDSRDEAEKILNRIAAIARYQFSLGEGDE